MKLSNQEMHPLFGIVPDDAVDMLIADHKRVSNLFADFKRLTEEGNDKKKAAVVERICLELTVHAELEEELFYPAVREATGDGDQVDEAVVEHAGAKALIAQLKGALPDEDLYDARVTVLGEQIAHHVEEEEGSMFPKARHSGLDTRGLGAQMLARKAELQANPGALSSLSSAAGEVSEEEDDEQKPRRTMKSVRSKNSPPASKHKAAKKKSVARRR